MRTETARSYCRAMAMQKKHWPCCAKHLPAQPRRPIDNEEIYMRLKMLSTAALLAMTAATFPAYAEQAAPAHSVGQPYAARNLADRIVLSAGPASPREVARGFRPRPEPNIPHAPTPRRI